MSIIPLKIVKTQVFLIVFNILFFWGYCFCYSDFKLVSAPPQFGLGKCQSGQLESKFKGLLRCCTGQVDKSWLNFELQNSSSISSDLLGFQFPKG